jgi:hypothetical protein
LKVVQEDKNKSKKKALNLALLKIEEYEN